jgi:hypothetical protein
MCNNFWVVLIECQDKEQRHAIKAFKNGNSQAVRIPAEIAYETVEIELDTSQSHNRLAIFCGE